MGPLLTVLFIHCQVSLIRMFYICIYIWDINGSEHGVWLMEVAAFWRCPILGFPCIIGKVSHIMVTIYHYMHVFKEGGYLATYSML